MRYPRKMVHVPIDSIDIYPGQVITVWGNTLPERNERLACQIEIRVNKHGTVEIFYDEEFSVVVDTFDHYYRITEEE
jgi:hypothetical protein